MAKPAETTVAADGYSRRSVLSWAFYDWANSAFATTVSAAFFPRFFRDFWNAGADTADTTFKLGMANGIAAAIIVLLAPVLGAVADRGGGKKKFLFAFAGLGIATTAALYLVSQGSWVAATLLYVLANIGFLGANIFYDSLLIGVAPPDKVDSVSALGFSVGYLGGGILFVVNCAMVNWPATFGLESQAQAVQLAFLAVAIWWAVFSIPLFIGVREPPIEDRVRGLQAIRAGFRQLNATFHEIRQQRVVFLFLLAYWFYIDGVDTIIRMGADFGLSLGFAFTDLMIGLIILQFIAFPAAIFFGHLGERIGAKTGILIGIGVYFGVAIYGYFLDSLAQFYALVIAIGLVQGGVQALSRSLYARLIPQDKAAEYFGFYNMLGKSAAVLGPMLMGWVSLLTGSTRYGILSLIILFAAGGFLLRRVDVGAGRPLAVAPG